MSMFREIAHSECPRHGAVIGSAGLLYCEIISKFMKCSGAILEDLNGLGLEGGLGMTQWVTAGPGLPVVIANNFKVQMTIYNIAESVVLLLQMVSSIRAIVAIK